MSRKEKNSWLLILARLTVGYLIMCALLWAGQDFLIFPGTSYSSGPYSVPNGVVSFKVSTADAETIEAWHYPAPKRDDQPDWDIVAMVFHGNGNILPFTEGMHTQLANAGISSYTIDYRGYGNSTGWPSEEGLYKDADALWEFVKMRHTTSNTRFIVWGISIGGGPATFLAEKIKSHALVLTATFSSLREVVQEHPIYLPFSWLLTHNFPNKERLSRFRNSCITLVHGEQDTVIPYSHMLRNQSAIHESNKLSVVSSKEADHNSIVSISLPSVLKNTLDCIISH